MIIPKEDQGLVFTGDVFVRLRDEARRAGDKTAVRVFNALAVPSEPRGVSYLPVRSLVEWERAIESGQKITNFGPSCLAKLKAMLHG